MKPSVLALITASLLTVAPLTWAGNSPMEKEMSQMNRNMKKLSGQFADPAKKASSLQIIEAIQKNITASKAITPPKVKKLSEADQAKYLETYKNDLDALDKEVALLKEAIAADKTEDAKAEMQKIGGLKRTSHKELADIGPADKKGPQMAPPAQPSSEATAPMQPSPPPAAPADPSTMPHP